MKKTAMRVSGFITLIMFFLLLLVSALVLCSALEITAVTDVIQSSEIVIGIIELFTFIFSTLPIDLLSLTGLALPEITLTILAVGLVAFCLWMFIWGIKEVTLANKDNQRFARCKNTCAFMMLTKFMFFAYLVAVIILSVVNEEFSLKAIILSEVFGISNFFLIITTVLAVLAFVIWLLPVINISSVYNAVKSGDGDFAQNIQGDGVLQNGDGQQMQNYNVQTAQPTMQANMPPMPGYNPQVVAQANAQQATINNQPQTMPQQNGAQSAQNGFVQPQMQGNAQAQPASTGSVVPGQNGVPANITEKGIADLERLERLKSMGAITPENYEAMKQKICSTNIN